MQRHQVKGFPFLDGLVTWTMELPLSLSFSFSSSLSCYPPPHQKQGNKHIPPVITLTLSALLHSHSFALPFPVFEV